MNDPSASIAPLIPVCLHLFSHCIEASVASHDEHAASIQQAAIDLRGRFKVWVSNIGAHKTGRSSLDYRLRHASHLKTRVVRFLEDLSEQLSDAIAILRGTRMPLEDVTHDSDSTDSESSDELGSSNPTELQQVFLDIGQIMTCLYKMSMVMRNPTPHDRYVKAKEIDTSFYEPHDIQHVREKYPKADEYLLVRLGKAISRRRQYFKYRELHKAKMEQFIDPMDTATVLSETAASTLEGLSHGRLSPKVSHPGSVSGMIETSYASYLGVLGSSTAQMPPMPKIAAEGQPFECPYCYMIDSVHDTYAWRKHVYRDLEPYLCTFDACSSSHQMYHSRSEWFNHEVQMHRSTWTCTEHCQQSFDSREKLVVHLQNAYPEISNHASTLLTMCTNDVDKNRTTSCPLCKISVTGLIRFRKHLGHHLEELAMFVLTVDSENAEDGQESLESHKSISVRQGTDDSDPESTGRWPHIDSDLKSIGSTPAIMDNLKSTGGEPGGVFLPNVMSNGSEPENDSDLESTGSTPANLDNLKSTGSEPENDRVPESTGSGPGTWDSHTICNTCGTQFTGRPEDQKSNLRRHMQAVQSENDRAPESIGSGPGTRDSPILDGKCEICGSQFKPIKVLRRHMRTRHQVPPDVTCPKRGIKFARKDKLLQHMRKQHAEEGFGVDKRGGGKGKGGGGGGGAWVNTMDTTL